MTDFNDVLNTMLLTIRSTSDFIKALAIVTPPLTGLGFYALKIWSRNSRAALETERLFLQSRGLRTAGSARSSTVLRGGITAIVRRRELHDERYLIDPSTNGGDVSGRED